MTDLAQRSTHYQLAALFIEAHDHLKALSSHVAEGSQPAEDTDAWCATSAKNWAKTSTWSSEAQTLPAMLGGQGLEEQQQYLTFMLSGETYAISILCIKEIIQYEQLTEVPRMPDFIRGVINLRGAVVR